jgi:hypothetical protein
MGYFQKSIKYLKSTLRLWTSNIDKAILYNNLARLSLCQNDSAAALKANRLCLENISSESNSILRERLQNKNFSLIAENKSKQELVSFLFYNNAALLEKIKIADESQFVYRKGYEFSLSTLGELSYLTNKFKPKLSASRSFIPKQVQSYAELRRKSFELKFDNSDFDCDLNYGSLVKNCEKFDERKNVRKSDNNNNWNVGKGKKSNAAPSHDVCFI